MTLDISFFLGLIPSIMTTMLCFYLQRKQKQRDELQEKKDKATEERAKARAREAAITMELSICTSDLTIANTKAIKTGKVNGEIEKALTELERVTTKAKQFRYEQVAEHLYI